MRFSDLPLRMKLMRMILIASSLALVATIVAVLIYDSQNFRPELVRNLKGVADLYRVTMPATLNFNDQKAATENLLALRQQRNVSLACVYNDKGKVFATYTRAFGDKSECPELSSSPSGHYFKGNFLYLFTAITYGNQIIGHILLRYNVPPLNERLLKYSLIYAAVLFSLFCASLLLLTQLEKYVSRPILKLAGVAKDISFRKEYSVRAPNLGHDEVGSLTDAFNHMLDTTEQSLLQEREARKDAEKALQIREDFISIAAHELRTPLTPLKLQLDLLKKIIIRNPCDQGRVATIERLINSSEDQIHRFSRLIEDMLDVSRIRTGKFSLHKEKVNLSNVVEEILQRYRVEIMKHHTKANVEIQDHIYGNWDRLRIEQIVINLLTNALKYGSGKPFTVSVTSKNNTAILMVHDEGIGISEEDQQRIFNRFERAVSLKHFGGFGLGLYITRQIVEAHGGSIKVVSQIGHGSSFIVELPMLEQLSGDIHELN